MDKEDFDSFFVASGDVGEASSYKVAKLLRKRGGPVEEDWLVVGNYLIGTDILDEQLVMTLAWRAQSYEDAPPFGDYEAMLEWDEA